MVVKVYVQMFLAVIGLAMIISITSAASLDNGDRDNEQNDVGADTVIDVDADDCANSFINLGVYCMPTCLHGDNEVRTSTGRTRVRDLNIGDKVLTIDASAQLKFEPVTLDLHKNEQMDAPFYKIRTKSGEVKVTPGHLIYVGISLKEAKLVKSDEVKAGDWLIAYEGDEVHVKQVTAVTRFTDVGIYNPLVASGRMFVGGILASNYVHLAPFSATHQHYSVWVIRQIDNIIPGFLAYSNNFLQKNINYIIENVVLNAYTKLF